MLKAGDTFFFAGIHSHLWVVITEPSGPNRTAIIVNMTSVRDEGAMDPACIIKKGEHEFVKHDTQIYYLKATELDLDGPYGAVAQSQFIQKNRPVSNALLKRIQQGALESRLMKKRYQDAVRKHLEGTP